MRRNALIVGALSLVFAASVAQAQDKPNFAGSWTIVVDPNAPAPSGRGGGGGLGQAATITQDDKTLTITRTTPNGEIKIVYNLDGSESKNMMMGRGGQMEQVSKATWEGNKLVVTTTMGMGTRTQTFTLDESGQLVVTTTSPGRGGGEPVTVTLTYKKG